MSGLRGHDPESFTTNTTKTINTNLYHNKLPPLNEIVCGCQTSPKSIWGNNKHFIGLLAKMLSHLIGCCLIRDQDILPGSTGNCQNGFGLRFATGHTNHSTDLGVNPASSGRHYSS
jgi:hypothetical protein